jgi:hypothetical protein
LYGQFCKTQDLFDTQERVTPGTEIQIPVAQVRIAE